MHLWIAEESSSLLDGQSRFEVFPVEKTRSRLVTSIPLEQTYGPLNSLDRRTYSFPIVWEVLSFRDAPSYSESC